MTTPDPDALASRVVETARSVIGQLRDCGALVVEAFAAVGITLEGDLLILHLAGEKIVGSELLAADLVFRTGRKDRYHPDDMRYGVGHVGIVTTDGGPRVVHARPPVGLVQEDSLNEFLDRDGGRYRGVRRIIARP